MKINNFSLTDETKLELARRFKAYRLSLNYTQDYISNKSGVSLGTIKSFERDGSISFDNLIKLLRVLNLLDNIDYLVPNLGLNSVDIHKLGHEKKRASKKKQTNKLSWGDEK